MTTARDSIVEHIPGLRRYARSLVGDAHRADDLVQDCLERALGRWHLWGGWGSLRAWLFTIMHNLHANGVRRRVAEPPLVRLEEAVRVSEPARQLDYVAMRETLVSLAALPEEQREVLLLVAVEGLTYEEVARVQGVAIGTVMSRLSRARARMREAVGEGPRLRRVK